MTRGKRKWDCGVDALRAAALGLGANRERARENDDRQGNVEESFPVSLRVFTSTFSLHLFTRTFGPDSLTGLKHLL